MISKKFSQNIINIIFFYNLLIFAFINIFYFFLFSDSTKFNIKFGDSKNFFVFSPRAENLELYFDFCWDIGGIWISQNLDKYFLFRIGKKGFGHKSLSHSFKRIKTAKA